jgi:hypothetical protein
LLNLNVQLKVCKYTYLDMGDEGVSWGIIPQKNNIFLLDD